MMPLIVSTLLLLLMAVALRSRAPLAFAGLYLSNAVFGHCRHWGVLTLNAGRTIRGHSSRSIAGEASFTSRLLPAPRSALFLPPSSPRYWDA